ncbi:DUF1285 domain-containing protein [Henriciella sp.]|uniref:DUF1285 domain-containing protein n=1 Tax=Henriciella sp. TaxID=1968823 RepID=UPI0026093734|nr:DUF1285 domain-containing protein [Henriciella sp.]
MAERDVNSKYDTVISLEELLKEISPDPSGRKLPPVEKWSPERSTDIDMEIKSDGSWWHEGSRINRKKLVRLFSTILRRDEDGSTWLVTPYEKVVVHVEDAPFVAVRVDRAGEPGPDQSLAFSTSVGDVVVAGPDNPIRVETDPETGEPSPYVLVRGRLEAKLARPVFYELAGMAVPDPEDGETLGVWSKGVFFPLGAAE